MSEQEGFEASGAAEIVGDPKVFLETPKGQMIHGNSVDYLTSLQPDSVDLIITSPPFALVSEKEYGNVPGDEYIAWFKPFAEQFNRVLKDTGSAVLDFGGAFTPGQPTRHLYQFELMILLCREYGFYLAQDFYWFNPARLPSPAEWVTIRRIRVKDAINTVWWLSKTPWPKASNTRVLQPYSPSMKRLFKNGYNAGPRPSGHVVSDTFAIDHGGAIPPNLLAISNTESNSNYLRYCKRNNLKAHPARFPSELPEFFIRMLTDEDDLVIDPFGGSCVTGEVAERLGRSWRCIELRKDYLTAAMGRFVRVNGHYVLAEPSHSRKPQQYTMFRPGGLWDDGEHRPLQKDGGKNHRERRSVERQKTDRAPKKDAAEQPAPFFQFGIDDV
ncbi:MAG: DNA-methyltransferase [Sphingomonas sp.]|uniref:DNA-methyltransferase n=1 Tax=Sphingomonas sp. TaxID=28214 RepID=UPI003F7CFB29